MRAVKIRYCIDTSSLIIFHRTYKCKDGKYEDKWKTFEELVMEGTILITKKVYDEICGENGKIRDDFLARMLRRLKGKGVIFTELEEILNEYKKIIQIFPGWVNPSNGRNEADVHVVALAMKENITVVTEESSDLKRLKIPKVCDEFGIRCIDLNTFLEEVIRDN